jgi:predicted acetyltransferase
MRRTFPEVYRRANARRPGAIELSEQFWDNVVEDFVPPGADGSPFFHLAYEQDGRIDGYARYRTGGQRVKVDELMSVSVEAGAALWRFCFDLDLMRGTDAVERPADDPLPWMLADSRRLRRSSADGVWIRLVDVAAALSGRRYMRSGGLALEVSDPYCPWNDGCYELTGGPDGAECRRSNAGPDLTLSVTDLAATYLGAVSFATLHLAGRVEEHTPGALNRADSMFASELKPWGPHGF